MASYLIAFDLGTGGNKAALYDSEGVCRAEAFAPYPTAYPHNGWHEQRPEDWWQAVVASTRQLLSESGIAPDEIRACGISGHSLGAVPLDAAGRLLRASTPIWSDSRADLQARAFFDRIDPAEWYRITGNGFPAQLYTVFKILWYRDNEADLFRQARHIIGTKDYINLRLTGRIATDFSYVSGSGVYDLEKWAYSAALIDAAGLAPSLFPNPVPSNSIIGELTREAAETLGLPQGIPVAAGGVDNACMALGAGCIRDGQVYNSQGSSSWIAVTTARPLLDVNTRPFVFAHVIPAMFTSAIGIFSTGSSLRWIRDQICVDLVAQAQADGVNVYDRMTALADTSPPGANGLIFHPNMAGGSSLDASPNLRGAFLNLDLGHTRADMIRAALEGIALQGRVALDALRALAPIEAQMLVVGGGSRSPLWRQIHADAYGMRIVKTAVDQQAAALGAAALAAVGSGLWTNFERIAALHTLEGTADPDPIRAALYEQRLNIFRQAGAYLAGVGDQIAAYPRSQVPQ